MSDIDVGYLFLLAIIIGQSVIIFILLRKRNKPESLGFFSQDPEERYSDLFDNANDAIFTLDKDHNYVDANRKAVELFGYSREEFLQFNVIDVIPQEQTSKSKLEFDKLNKDGKYELFTGKQKTKDGRWLDIEVNSSAILNNGEVVGSRDIVRDITLRKEREAMLETMIRELNIALDEIETLKGLLPVCSCCHKIRDKNGYWEKMESYISSHSQAEFTHSYCPECIRELYPDLADEILNDLDDK